MRNSFRPCLLVLIFTGCIGTLSCSGKTEPRSQVEFLLGTTCSVTIYDKAPSDIFSRVFNRVREIENLMSINIEGSEISEINLKAGDAPVRVSEDTFDVVVSGLEFGELSGGRFDISVGPLVALWGIGTDREKKPGPGEIRAALGRMDYRKVRTDPAARSIFLPEPGMAVDLGAIAKGYAADETGRILRKAGVKSSLIDFGGNILVIGRHPSGRDWKIGVQNPDLSRGTYIGIVRTFDAAVVTSGIYERFFTDKDGTRYHHILDTRTGYPVDNGLTGVTIVTKDSIVADALSTTLFALGLEEGLELAERIEGVEALFITEKKKLHPTSGFREIFDLTDRGYSFAD